MFRPTLVTFSPKKSKKARTSLDLTKLLQPNRRWLFNEEKQLANRKLDVNLAALADVVRSASGSPYVTGIEQLGEGRFNRTLLFKLGDRREVIARIPFPTAGPVGLCTKSEVATMDFLRFHFGSLIPKVLAWKATKANEVGSEYIVMEKARGKTGQSTLPSASIVDLLRFQNQLATIRFSSYGSIFYKEDVDPHLQQRPLYASTMVSDACSDRFRIGPSVERSFYRSERHLMKIDRGPWTDTQGYNKALVESEIKWIESYSNSPSARRQLGSRSPPTHHIKRLEQWVSLFPHIQPLADLCAPTLSHPDLSLRKFSLEGKPTPSLSSIFDWQGAVVRPFFLTHTPFLAPAVVSDLSDGLYPAAQYLASVITRYDTLAALKLPRVEALQGAMEGAPYVWSTGLTSWEKHLISLFPPRDRSNGMLFGSALQFTKSEMEQYFEEEKKMDWEGQLFGTIKTRLANLGIDLDSSGSVPAEQYSEAIKAIKFYRTALTHTWHTSKTPFQLDKVWPIREGRWDSSLEACQ